MKNDASIAEQQEAIHLVMTACTEDDAGYFASALTYYIEAATLLLPLIKSILQQYCCIDHRIDEKNVQCKMLANKIASNVIERAEIIKKQNTPYSPVQQTIPFFELCAHYCIEKGISSDESKKYNDAFSWYTEASGILLQLLKLLTHEKEKQKYSTQLANILERAEMLKKLNKRTKSVSGLKGRDDKKFTKEEIAVLKSTSVINNKLFLPWSESDALNMEKHKPFTDPDGFLTLSERQKKHFVAWRRPKEFMLIEPKMICMISAYTVTQSVITDCSFVASLIVAAMYERKHNKQLITNIIYPQNKQGKPIVNKGGKYMIRLFFNGIPRQVVIDDYLPVNSKNELLCSYSNNRSELWVSLIEKAYMKVNGGYNFPGSNSGIDLHALTGWIPEEIIINGENFNMMKVWKQMINAYHYGDCLITISTGALDETLAEQLGLYEKHAYAVLNVKEVRGYKLLQVKNPWTQKRWKGKFSPHDTKSWTKELLKDLNYDLLGALQYDNGVFWVDFESVCKYFSVIHMSWNPDLFGYKCVVHEEWKPNPNCTKDKYTMGYNPQYKLQITGKGSVWVMLTRHIVDHKNRNQEYLTLHVYKSDKRIYYHNKPLKRGTYSNNPHYLVSLDSDQDTTSVYTLVVSQYDKIQNIKYTLNVYSTVPAVLEEIPLTLPFVKSVKGKWDQETAGGSCNQHTTYMLNPQYALSVNKPTSVLIRLETKCPYSVNIMVCRNSGQRVRLATTDVVITSSGNYRTSFCYCELNYVSPKEVLTLVCSTFNAGEIGEFLLTVESDSEPVNLTLL